MTFPHVVDSHIRSTWVACPQKFLNQHILNLRNPEDSDVDLHFGGCFAKAIETARRAYYTFGKTAKEAVDLGLLAAHTVWGDYVEPQVPTPHVKNWRSLLVLVDGYFKKWPLETDPLRPVGDNAIEYTFAIRTGIKHPDNPGEEILYGGRFDMLGTLDGLIMPVDEKTTGRGWWNFATGWDMRGQFIGYVLGAQVNGYPTCGNILVRGCYITKTMEDYKHILIPITQHTIERWWQQVYTDITNMIQAYTRNEYSYNYADSCKLFKPCSYIDLCTASVKEHYLGSYYKVPAWNPLAIPGGEL